MEFTKRPIFKEALKELIAGMVSRDFKPFFKGGNGSLEGVARVPLDHLGHECKHEAGEYSALKWYCTAHNIDRYYAIFLEKFEKSDPIKNTCEEVPVFIVAVSEPEGSFLVALDFVVGDQKKDVLEKANDPDINMASSVGLLKVVTIAEGGETAHPIMNVLSKTPVSKLQQNIALQMYKNYLKGEEDGDIETLD